MANFGRAKTGLILFYNLSKGENIAEGKVQGLASLSVRYNLQCVSEIRTSPVFEQPYGTKCTKIWMR